MVFRAFFFFAVGAGFLVPLASPHDIITTKLTYTREVSRILSARCLSCHSTSNSIPLTTYEQVRPWAVSIKEQVLSRSMPPWGAVKGFGDLQPDSGLSQEELLIIAAWVIGGAPEGNRSLLATSTRAIAPKDYGSVKDGVTVNTEATLRRTTVVAGVRPVIQTNVESAQLTATLPSGEVLPLVWLYRFHPEGQQTFRFRSALTLPAGTVVCSSAPLRFVLETPGT